MPSHPAFHSGKGICTVIQVVGEVSVSCHGCCFGDVCGCFGESELFRIPQIEENNVFENSYLAISNLGIFLKQLQRKSNIV